MAGEKRECGVEGRVWKGRVGEEGLLYVHFASLPTHTARLSPNGF